MSVGICQSIPSITVLAFPVGWSVLQCTVLPFGLDTVPLVFPPFGLNTVPQVFTELMKSVAQALSQQGIKVMIFF